MKFDLNWFWDGGRLRLPSLLSGAGVFAQALWARVSPLFSRIPSLGANLLPRLGQTRPVIVAWAALAAIVPLSIAALATFHGDEFGKTSPAATAALPIPEPAVAPPKPDPAPAWRLNARPVTPGDNRPRLAVIVGGLGLAADTTQAAIALPPDITLAFVSYGRNLSHWIELARAAGHEVLVAVPMEPIGYPADDPGPRPLLATLSPAENAKRFAEVLPLAGMAVGITNLMGGRFMGVPEQVEPLFAALAEQGLLFVEHDAAPDSPATRIAAERRWPLIASASLLVGEEIGPQAFAARLTAAVERVRKERAGAVTVEPHPYVLEALQTLPARLDKDGIMLAPVSGLAPGATGTERAALPVP